MGVMTVNAPWLELVQTCIETGDTLEEKKLATSKLMQSNKNIKQQTT